MTTETMSALSSRRYFFGRPPLVEGMGLVRAVFLRSRVKSLRLGTGISVPRRVFCVGGFFSLMV
jgi:hypothetical protein